MKKKTSPAAPVIESRTNLRQRLADGDGFAAAQLAREYARENKTKESCVCLRIALKLDPEAVTAADSVRNAALWAKLGEAARKACVARADKALMHIRLAA